MNKVLVDALCIFGGCIVLINYVIDANCEAKQDQICSENLKNF